jgi:hypothetical protein
MTFRSCLGMFAGLALVAGGTAAAGGVKLPKQLTTPTGNFITLYAFQATGSAANADVKICTSARTPKGTEAIPQFFTLKLSNGAIVHLTSLSPKSPALNVTPLGPKQCIRGWITFAVPRGARPTELLYTYGTPLVWKVA